MNLPVQHFEADVSEAPVIKMYRVFNEAGNGRPATEPMFEAAYEGTLDYHSIKHWMFRESLPPVLRLGAKKNMSKALAGRTHMAFRQQVVRPHPPRISRHHHRRS